MTQEQKQLVLKDLCARLPYGVQCEIGGLRYGPYTFTGNDIEDLIAGRMFKPYLRPMSSMTEEEKEEYGDLDYLVRFATNSICASVRLLDFCNSHHLDYHGLIPMGLALEATKDMYNI